MDDEIDQNLAPIVLQIDFITTLNKLTLKINERCQNKCQYLFLLG